MTDRHSADSSAFNRAQLIMKLAVGAFAIPVIATFKLDSLARAGTRRGGHSYPNQTEPNQTYPNQQARTRTGMTARSDRLGLRPIDRRSVWDVEA